MLIIIKKITLLFFCVWGYPGRLVAQKQATHQADSIYRYGKATDGGTGKFYMSREIAQLMNSGGSSWLERSTRQEEENTQLAIEKINLLPANVVADIGAGTGYYTFRLSHKVPKGKVYAVEIQDVFIQYLKNQKAQLKDSIVEVIKGTEQSPNLPDNSIDLAIMVDVYHELMFPHEMLQAIRKALKQHGKILLIEYRGEDPAVAIKALHKTTVAQITRELNANGFQLKYNGDFLPIQHFLLFEKN